MCLENILINYFNLPEDNDKKDWYKSYGKLTQLLEDLEKLDVINNSYEIIEKLDKIDNEVI